MQCALSSFEARRRGLAPQDDGFMRSATHSLAITAFFVGWVERSETHHLSNAPDGFRKGSTHPTITFSIPIGDRQFFRRKQRDHLTALVGHDDFLLDAGRRKAVLGRAI